MAVDGEVNGGLVLLGAAQLGGAALVGWGATAHTRVLVRDGYALRTVAPVPLAGGGGLVLGGTF